jgi:hypothetical protein
MSNNQQITSGGVAQQSGLETFSSIINYTGEFLNWGNALDYVTQLTSDTDYATTAANPLTDALINSPATVLNQWYRYHTSGSPYTSVLAPESRGGYFIFNGQKSGGLDSYSGMYQKLVLTQGKEYEVSIKNTINTDTGTMYVKTYTANGSDDFTETSSATISFPISSASDSTSKFDFTSVSANDIIVIYFTTTSTNSIDVGIVSISIKEKQEYLLPLYAQDIYGNAHKVLRLNAGNTISDD